MKRLNLDRWMGVLLALVAGTMVLLAPSVVFAQEAEESQDETAEVATEEEVEADEPAEEPAEEEPAVESDEDAEAEEGDEEEAAGHGDGEHHGDHGHHDLGHGNATDSLSSPAAFSKDLAIYTFVVFLGLMTLLLKFAWPTISEALEAREKRIEGNIAEAENKLEDAKKVMAEHEAKLASAADQVRELLEEARRDADATIAQAKADAKAEFEAERQRATRDIEQASDAAVRQLAEKTAGLAIDLAGRVVKQDISADRQNEIVREALGRFSESGSN